MIIYEEEDDLECRLADANLQLHAPSHAHTQKINQLLYISLFQCLYSAHNAYVSGALSVLQTIIRMRFQKAPEAISSLLI